MDFKQLQRWISFSYLFIFQSHCDCESDILVLKVSTFTPKNYSNEIVCVQHGNPEFKGLNASFPIMDKFVIRKPKDSTQSTSANQGSRGLRQARLHQLQGVVVLEELNDANAQLTKEDVTPAEKVEILKKLQDKKPGKDVLKSTGIGRTVHKLSKSPDLELAQLASKIYQCWKSHVLHILHRKPIEVQSDLETQQARNCAQKLINMGLSNIALAEQLENCVFNKCKKLINKTYNRVIRKIHFTLKNNEELRHTINNLDCDFGEFVDDMHKQVIKVYSQ